MVYLAPEGYLFAAGEDVKVGKPLDVFALGVLFHQIFQGCVPEFVSGTKYNYLFEGLLSGDELKLGDAVPADMARLIAGMLETDPVRRYSLDTVVRLLSGEDIRPEQQAENREATQNDREQRCASTSTRAPRAPKNSSRRAACFEHRRNAT